VEGVGIPVDQNAVAEFCRRWRVAEFALYGSVVRDDFRPDSDVDVLVTPAEEDQWSLDAFLEMVRELRLLFGREVDLNVRSNRGNPFIRHHILKTRRIVHAG